MSIAISEQDTNLLLTTKNVLEDTVLDKYQLAGKITQTTLQYITSLINSCYHDNNKDENQLFSISQLCFLADLFMNQLLNKDFKGKTLEKGIAFPCSIDIDEISNGWSPELGDTTFMQEKNRDAVEKNLSSGIKSSLKNFLSVGDLAKITLGCHIDGYTSQITHTLCVYPTEVNSATGLAQASGPLLGAKADAAAIAHIAKEVVVNLLASAASPEKLPESLRAINVNGEAKVTGHLIRKVVNHLVESYNCALVPGSKIRRIRRFLAGQNEGVVAEREFKGCVWYESDQETAFLNKSHQYQKDLNSNEQSKALTLLQNSENTHENKQKSAFIYDSAIATDSFTVLPGEVYLVDLKIVSLSETPELGLISVETLSEFSGTTATGRNMTVRNSQFIRDFTQLKDLKLRASRECLAKMDKQSVYPVKLTYLSDEYQKLTQSPIELNLQNINYTEEQAIITKENLKSRMGMNEIMDNFLATSKAVQIVKYIPWELIVNLSNPEGVKSIDAVNPTLPGFEIPLPKLNISALKLKSLFKHADTIPLPVAREACTVAITDDLTYKLTHSEPIYLNSNFELNPLESLTQGVYQLVELAKDSRFGIKVRTVKPLSDKAIRSEVPDMTD
ncbi:hypothetical protein QEN19_001774 [Hanseniaspora menglaensis]